jgi:centromeric protein E
MGKLEEEVKKREEKVAWAAELVRQLDKEKKVGLWMLVCFIYGANNRLQLRIKLEEERRALASFVCKFDSLGLGLSILPLKLKPAKPTPGCTTNWPCSRSHSLPSSLIATSTSAAFSYIIWRNVML